MPPLPLANFAGRRAPSVYTPPSYEISYPHVAGAFPSTANLLPAGGMPTPPSLPVLMAPSPVTARYLVIETPGIHAFTSSQEGQAPVSLYEGSCPPPADCRDSPRSTLQEATGPPSLRICQYPCLSSRMCHAPTSARTTPAAACIPF